VSGQKKGVAKTPHCFSFVLVGRFVRLHEGGITERARHSTAILRVLGAIVDGHENGGWWRCDGDVGDRRLGLADESTESRDRNADVSAARPFNILFTILLVGNNYI
jgi:hypothetical protein